MVHQAKDLSPEQKAAAELLLGRRLEERETVSVQAFSEPPVSDERRREVAARLRELFASVNENLKSTSEQEAEEIFIEAMRSSRPGFKITREDHS